MPREPGDQDRSHTGITAAVEEAGLSVSAWLTEVARQELRRLDRLAAMAEYWAEHGAFTDGELAGAVGAQH